MRYCDLLINIVVAQKNVQGHMRYDNSYRYPIFDERVTTLKYRHPLLSDIIHAKAPMCLFECKKTLCSVSNFKYSLMSPLIVIDLHITP